MVDPQHERCKTKLCSLELYKVKGEGLCQRASYRSVRLVEVNRGAVKCYYDLGAALSNLL